MSKAHDRITDFIVKELENGVCPWKKPWNTLGSPKNAISKKEYNGINSLVLSIAMRNFSLPYFLTFNQLKKLGGEVKGQKGFPIVFFTMLESEKFNKEGKLKKQKIPFAKTTTVFNVEQIKGIDLTKYESVKDNKDNDIIGDAQAIIDNWENKPEIEFKENRAYYRPSTDVINMPKIERFHSSEEYYSTLFHEAVHSTGHESRLDRLKKVANFGSEEYSKEELVAELGSCFLCSNIGIEEMTIKNSASYINSWIKVLKNDTKLIMSASSQAQKAVNMILGKDKK